MSRKLPFLSCLLAFAVTCAAYADDETKSVSEATELLRAAMPSKAFPSYVEMGGCLSSSEWSQIPVPQSFAQEVFGTTVQADLIAPEPVPDSETVLAAVEPDAGKRCSDSQIKEWQNKAADKKNPLIHTWKYTYPVFDLSFTKGVVIWTDLYQGKGVEFTVTALMFEKRDGHWVLSKSEVIGQT